MSQQNKPKPPEIGPYVFTAILAFFGLWCFYDGWFSTDPDMQEHLLFNRIAAGLLIPWAIFDFFRTRKKEQRAATTEKKQKVSDSAEPEDSGND